MPKITDTSVFTAKETGEQFTCGELGKVIRELAAKGLVYDTGKRQWGGGRNATRSCGRSPKRGRKR
jgi:hypothetical protein